MRQVRASTSPDQALRLSTRWNAAKPGSSARPRVPSTSVTVRGRTASTAPTASAATVARVRPEKASRYGHSHATKLLGRTTGRAMGAPAGRWMLTPQQRPADAIAMTKNDPVLERTAAYPWPRGGIVARRMNRGDSLFSARTGVPVARLRPLAESNRVEVLWWRRDAGGRPEPSGRGSTSTTPSPSSPTSRPSGSAPEGLLSHNAQSRANVAMMCHPTSYSPAALVAAAT